LIIGVIFKMSFLVNSILFFSFFICLSVFNINTVTWGLQLSWFLGIIFIILMSLSIVIKSNITITKKFKYYLLLVTYFIVSTFVSLFLVSQNFLNLSENFISNEIMTRSFTHFIYLIFNWIVAIHMYIYFQHTQNFNYILKYFISYPSIVIMLIGVYGYLATFGLVPVDTFLHNNLSLGYTFERFKSSHRTASIFAEPSHYGAYLAFLLPIMYAYYKKKIKLFPFLYRIPILILYISQIILIKSMSFYLVLPIIFLISYFFVNNKEFKVKYLLFISPIIIILTLFIFVLMQSRISLLLSGEDGSFVVRFGMFLHSIELFQASPLIGVGYGAIRGVDSLSTLLATIGLMGVIVFVLFIKKLNSKLNSLQKLIYIGFITMLIDSLVADGMTDFLHFWIMISLLLVVENKKKFINMRTLK